MCVLILTARVAANRSISRELRASEGHRIALGFETHVHRHPVTESGQSACSRLSEYRTPDGDEQLVETILFVGHANVFRYWLCRALQLPQEAWLRISLYHGSITSLWISSTPLRGGDTGTVAECTVTVDRVGDVGHLPRKLLSR